MILRAWAVAALVTLPGAAWGQAASAIVQIKAAYLYKFGSFVEWPEGAFGGPAAPIVIGVLGAEALAAELEQVVAGRKVRERPVSVRRVRAGEPVAGLHILFIGEAQNARLAEIASGARGQPVLIVSESESATGRGSMINFVTAENRVRFDVALMPAEAGRLRISARLLTVARRVTGGPS